MPPDLPAKSAQLEDSPDVRASCAQGEPTVPVYPYAQQPPLPELPPSKHFLAAMHSLVAGCAALLRYRMETPAPARYVVPRRFGMSAMFGIMTALAILFGGFHWGEAYPVFYLFFGVQAILICLAQMFYGEAPRAASTVAGALILPAFIIAGAMLSGGRWWGAGLLCFLLFSVPFGAFLGYITGTMAAGVFLVMDAAESYFFGPRDEPASNPASREQ